MTREDFEIGKVFALKNKRISMSFCKTEIEDQQGYLKNRINQKLWKVLFIENDSFVIVPHKDTNKKWTIKREYFTDCIIPQPKDEK